MAQTFKWYTGHSEVATWKDIPQDAKELVAVVGAAAGRLRHGPPAARCPLADPSLTELDPERLRQLGAEVRRRLLDRPNEASRR